MAQPDGRQMWDISQKLRPSLPVWPGDTPFGGEATWKIADGSPVNVSRLTLSTHSGAHADAPLHYAADAADIASVDLEPYLGGCQVIDARAAGALIGPEFADDLVETKRVLFRTYDGFPHDEWDESFTAIAPETIVRLAAQGVRLVGLDAPSLDPQNSKSMDAHKAVLAADMRVLEGLVLDHVPPGRYELIALPLAIEDADASPVRAILRSLT